MGIAIAGLAADGRVLAKYMRTECLNHRYIYESPMQTERLVLKLSDKSQISTQRYSKRPYGVGILVSGFDQTGTHLYQTEPSGNFYSFKAIAIGARSQSAKTYLEKNFESFENLGEEDLIKHALIALRGTTGDNVDLTSKNTSVSIVSKDGYKSYEDDEVAKWVDIIKQEKKIETIREDEIEEKIE